MSVILHANTDFDQVMVKHPKGFDVILVKVDGQVHGYVNRCPHLGISLDYGDGKCLSAPNELFCAMHGAMFTADTGHCFSGPCEGDSLERLVVRIEDGKVVCDGG